MTPFSLRTRSSPSSERDSSKGVKFKSDMFVKGKAAQDREDRIVYDSKTGALYYDQDGTGSNAQVKIATLVEKPQADLSRLLRDLIDIERAPPFTLTVIPGPRSRARDP